MFEIRRVDLYNFCHRTDPHVILTLEKAIMRGKPVLLRNCEENIDNIITPLMHHRNTANEDDRNEGMTNAALSIIKFHKTAMPLLKISLT